MLDLIKKEMSETSAIGHVSQRLNARKLAVGFHGWKSMFAYCVICSDLVVSPV